MKKGASYGSDDFGIGYPDEEMEMLEEMDESQVASEEPSFALGTRKKPLLSC